MKKMKRQTIDRKQVRLLGSVKIGNIEKMTR